MRPILISSILVLLTIFRIYGEGIYPEINSLNIRDNYFKQIGYDTKEFYMARKKNGVFPTLIIYSYTPKKGTNIYQIAGNLSLPYSTIATLNRFAQNKYFNGQEKILVPNQPGLFIFENPKSDLEYIIKTKRDVTDNLKFKVKGSTVYYTTDYQFNNIELAYFLNVLSIFPVPKGRISSDFGYRKDPFTSEDSFHDGVDIAAPYGSDVIAPRGGTVEFIGENDLYGKFFIIIHSDNNKTLYGHLSKVLVEENQIVNTGDKIGLIGSTGRSTGPHLHFEFIKKGKKINPKNLINY